MVHRTSDLDVVGRILNHPMVYGMISDDTTPDPYEPVDGLYIMNDEETGVVRIDPVNGICCIVHIATLPELWGTAESFVMEVIDWGINNTAYNKVIALVPEYNKLTLRLCLKCGFEQEGRIKKSFLKNWKFHDLVLFGLTKTDFTERRQLCHQQHLQQ